MFHANLKSHARVIAFLGLLWSSLVAVLFVVPMIENADEVFFMVTGGQADANSQDILALVDAESLVLICEIQGRGFASSYAGQSLRTQGVVIADFDTLPNKGFFLQNSGCDSDPATSDGIFVYIEDRLDLVNPGDLVEVSGTVQEYFGLTEILVSPGEVTILANSVPLPEPVDLEPPFDEGQAGVYFESLEGMLAGMGEARVVGPTSQQDETWVIRADLGLERVFRDDPRGTGEIVTVDDSGLFAINPPARVGDLVLDLAGPLGYGLGAYRMHLVAEPTLLPGLQTRNAERAKAQIKQLPVQDATSFTFSVASMNLENLFDPFDDPTKEDPILSAAAYQRKLSKLARVIQAELDAPALIGMQEAENLLVLQDLVANPDLDVAYAPVLVEGPDVRGIDVGLLYRQDRVRLLEVQSLQGCTALVDGLGPDGNRDVINPQNAQTCDTDGDGTLDGNRLFSRPPLLARVQVCGGSCTSSSHQTPVADIELTLMVNHWKSKSQDTPWIQYTLPRRNEQARHVAQMTRQILEQRPDAHLVVLGDFNDYPASEPLAILQEAGLGNLMSHVAPSQRYTFIYQGVSQVLDHLLVNSALQDEFVRARVLHLNADFPSVYADSAESIYRSSDHDPVLIHFTAFANKAYLPCTLSVAVGG